MDKPPGEPLTQIGWREWVGLPDFGVRWIKAKIDTGARSSSLHALNVETFRRDGMEFVRFDLYPHQRDDDRVVAIEMPVVDHRRVRSSTGHLSTRPVIATKVQVCGQIVTLELTLANRIEMGFRMLLGRLALKGRFLVNSNRSYLGGKPPKKKNSAVAKPATGAETSAESADPEFGESPV